jgi:hypothetical protein
LVKHCLVLFGGDGKGKVKGRNNIIVLYQRTPLIGKTLFGFVWRGWEREGKGKE